MLQSSADGDPAAPAGFAEALSVTPNKKSALRGAFFMPGILQNLPVGAAEGCDLLIFVF
jgi:hypothetical protein